MPLVRGSPQTEFDRGGHDVGVPTEFDQAPTGSASLGDRSSPAFVSILYAPEAQAGNAQEPAYFRDLNLDQIVDAAVAGREEYDLKPFFHDPLRTVEAVRYRHGVMQDLEREGVAPAIKTFAERLRAMRKESATSNKSRYKYERERWILHAIETYCDAVDDLRKKLESFDITSTGLTAFRKYLGDYVASEHFQALRGTLKKVCDLLAAVHYAARIKSTGFRVQNYDAEPDYSQQVTRVFERFQQGAVTDYRVEFREEVELNYIEAQILDYVALLNPDAFSALIAFAAENADYIDPAIARFDREIQFYLAYLDYTEPLRRASLSFCYPTVSDSDKAVRSEDTFDLALAAKLIRSKSPVICNDLLLTGKERIIVVSGPNQGGKTTFARTFGQIHYLASIGCPVPGRNAAFFLFDTIFTHFEREESVQTLRGKLQDDLMRIHEILGAATPRSIIIMNEIFNSTTLRDATYLAHKIVDRIIALDALCVCVTFLEELASINEKTVSMVSTIVPEHPALRTFKVVRRPADGRSYAISIAEKYRLTFDCLKTRLHLPSDATSC